MNTKIKQLALLATAGFLLAACGQNKQEETTVATTVATTEATTQATTQVSSGSQTNLPKDGEATYKLDDKGAPVSIKYYFKDDIVYKQDAVYTYDPKGLGKSDKEVAAHMKKREALFKDVKGITYTTEKIDGKYVQKVTFDYNTLDFKELHKRAPQSFPTENPKPLKYSDAVKSLLKNGYVKQ